MIIYIPEFTKKESSCIISARFELDKPVPYVPEKLWYSFPEEYAPLLNTRSDAFAPVGLLAAMYTGEDLEVQGLISPLLAANLLKYRDLYHEWWPDLFKMVEISFDQLVPPEQGPGKPMVMTAFSGGVDSFYSLWENLPDRQPDPEKQITHGLFIEGIDLYMDDRENFESVYEQYASMFADLGLDLLRAATNARKFLELRVNWTRIFGAATISIAHLFSNQLRRFYFPSDVAVSWVDNIHGSSPLTDPLLSSEVLEIVHQGILPGRV